jgi:integrase
MRRGELLGLRWCDPDLTGGALAIRQTLQSFVRLVLLDQLRANCGATPAKQPADESKL